MKRLVWIVVLLSAIVVALNIFLSFRFSPAPDADQSFRERAQEQSGHGLTVRAAALGPRESCRSFGENLAAHDIQPIWMSIDNNTDDQLVLLTIAIDPSYYSPYEVSYRFHGVFSWTANKARDQFFADRQISNFLPARSRTEGFVYANLDSGVKLAHVVIGGKDGIERFEFALLVPGPAFVGENVSVSKLYQGQEIKSLDLDTLKAALAALPCCTSNAQATQPGDPLNCRGCCERQLGT